MAKLPAIPEGAVPAICIWDDAWSDQSSDIPAANASAGPVDPCIRHTIGWLIKAGDDILLWHTADMVQPGNKELCYTHRWRIPKGMVKKIIYLEPRRAKPRAARKSPPKPTPAPCPAATYESGFLPISPESNPRSAIPPCPTCGVPRGVPCLKTCYDLTKGDS